MKFEITDLKKGYWLHTKTSNYLIALGGGVAIYLYKENNKGSSYCYHHNNNFDYHETENPLVGGSGIQSCKYFTPKRITVIQMK